jgi:Fe-S-cluster-containing hydrogenase component 2
MKYPAQKSVTFRDALTTIKINSMFQERTIKAIIHTHFDKCTGCSICQLACSMDLIQGYNPRRSRLDIQHKHEHLYHIPVVCSQCENAYCMNVCPARAIKRLDNSIVGVDPDKCVGCGLCAEYCPVDMIKLDPDSQKAQKCELCQGNPLCVDACPTGALELVLLRNN